MGSIPNGMKKKKLYDEDSKFTEDDLQDVLDGLLKLGVSNTTKESPTNSKSSSSSPPKYNSSNQQQPSFLANTAKKRTKPNVFSGFNLLFEAAKKVEGKENFFKMDIADIDRVTHSNVDCKDNDKETEILRMIKSKNAIDANDSLFGLPTFDDLGDDFSPIPTSFNRRLSGISSIGRRSSIISLHNMSNLNPLQSIEDIKEQRKQTREYSIRNIKEMDKMYLNKSKLAQKLQSESPQTSQMNQQQKSIQTLSKSSGADIICKEFSESNKELKNVINTYKENVDQIKEYHRINNQEKRKRQNEILQQQLQRMQDRIQRQQQQENDMMQRRKKEL